MKTSTRLALGFGGVLAVLLPVVVYLGHVIHRVVEMNHAISVAGTQMLVTSWEQMDALHRYRENAQKWWITGDARYQALADSAWRGFGRRLEELESLPTLGGAEDEIRRLSELWVAAGGEPPPGQSAVSTMVGPRDALVVLDARVGPLREQTRRVHEAGRAGMEAEVRRSDAIAERAEDLAVGVGVGAVLLALLVAGLVIRSLSGSLTVLRAGTRAVARGDFEHRLDASRPDEFGEVARDFNRMTERLGELDRLKRDFVSHVSHELKTPLASMQEVHHALLDELPGPLTERQRRQIELNRRSGERLSRMITRLLDLSKIEAGTMDYDFQPADVRPLVRHALEPFEARGPDVATRLEVHLPQRAVHLWMDEEYLAQVLANLVENALKFSPPGSPVRISVDLGDSLPSEMPEGQRDALEVDTAEAWAILRVDDAGPGVAAADRERIFERFVRLPPLPGQKRPRGTGLGLALSREIVHAHGGALWVEDRPDGPGARFTLAVPALPAAPAAAEPARRAEPLPVR